MKCPSCKGYELQANEIEVGLLAAEFVKCEGKLLSIMHYQYWLEKFFIFHHDDIEAASVEVKKLAPVDSHEAKLCPKCSRLMSKFQIEHDIDNRLDMCAACEEVWLDKGEWQLLKSLDLQSDLPKIFTDAWQRKIRIQKREEYQKERYIGLLGEDDFNKVDNFQRWVNAHPEKLLIRQYIVASSIG